MSVTGSNLEDRILWMSANRSLVEISAALGGTLTPEEVGAKVVQLLHDRNWLSAAQRRQLLQDQLFELIQTYMNWARQGSIPSAKLIKELATELRNFMDNGNNANLADEMLAIQASHAEKMGRGMSLGFQMMLSVLRESGVELSDERAMEILKKVSAVAFAEVDRHVEKLEA